MSSKLWGGAPEAMKVLTRLDAHSASVEWLAVPTVEVRWLLAEIVRLDSELDVHRRALIAIRDRGPGNVGTILDRIDEIVEEALGR